MSQAPQRCPACGGDNGCEVARSGRTDVDCWCMRITMAAVSPVPAGAQPGSACLCRDCARDTGVAMTRGR
ncbi:MAG: cysteine-rich CWC family protein [Steroidobacteraceae bacterium]